jgi:hypothetical protein
LFPFIENDICPGEGCQFGPWKIKSFMKAYLSRGDSTRIAFSLHPNEEITAIKGDVIILKPGLVLINRTTDDFHVNDTAFLLSYISEGVYDAWYGGKILEITSGDPAFTFLREATTEWWVYIKNRQGKFGWLKVNDGDLQNIEGRSIF